MKILFLCVANSARSQMAEGLAKSILKSKCSLVQSAGSKPTRIAPESILVLKELGIDISHQESKDVDRIDPTSVDLVITLCDQEICPVFLNGAKRLHWPMPDPARISSSQPESRIQEFRKVRDSIAEELRKLEESIAGG